jgi:hypothetical protein
VSSATSTAPAAIEAARGPLPPSPRHPGRPELAALDLARQNELRLRLGGRAFRSRRVTEFGALTPGRFRTQIDEVVIGFLGR